MAVLRVLRVLCVKTLPMKHPHAVRTATLCGVTAAGELALLAGVASGINLVSPGGAMLLSFVLGPPLFLALLAWRRRSHLARGRLLFAAAVVVAGLGFGLLGYDLYRHRADAALPPHAGPQPDVPAARAMGGRARRVGGDRS